MRDALSAACQVLRQAGVRHSVLGKSAHWLGFVSGALAGTVFNLLEKPTRRLEIALVVFGKSLENVWGIANLRGFGGVRHGDTLLFAASLAVLSHAFTEVGPTVA